MTLEIDKIKTKPINILKKLVNHLGKSRKKQIFFVLILSFFSSIAESVSIALLVPFVSFFVNPDFYLFNNLFSIFFNFFNINSKEEILIFVSTLFIVAVLLSCLIKMLYIKFSQRLSQGITSDFRIKIFNFLINQDFSYYFNHGANELMSNLSQKTSSFTTIINASINIINSFLISIAIITVLIINEPLYTPIIATVVILFFLIIYKLKSQSVFKKGENVNLNQNILIDIFENTVGYLQEIILYNLRNFYSKIFIKASEETARSTTEINTIGAYPRILLETFIIVFVVMFIFMSDFYDRPFQNNISYLAILAFGAQKFLPLINNIYKLSIDFRGDAPIVLSFLKILEKEKIQHIESSDNETLEFTNSIKLENISFKYDNSSLHILKNISLNINKGEKIAIKGNTGSGKSTLVNIISGLLDPSSGKLIVDNNIVHSNNKKKWQKNISFVPQVVFLNDASVMENIAIGVNLDDINLDKVKSVAKLAQIDKLIDNLPNKYNEKVGEKGIRLSGGERQRVGIARALYRDAGLIIMDEPTNSLDIGTEKKILDVITKYKDISIIMISHSNNALKYFDKIIDLDKIRNSEKI